MKVELKELYNRSYIDKSCVAFDYQCLDLEDVNKQELFEARFRRSATDNKVWTMYVVLLRNKVADAQVYSVEYQLPKADMSLTMICAIGLKYFQLQLKDEIQRKVEMDIMIGRLTSEM